MRSQSSIATCSEVDMSIDIAVKSAVKKADRTGEFIAQLERNRNFVDRMEKAGVVTRKQEFSIPLMERIARST